MAAALRCRCRARGMPSGGSGGVIGEPGINNFGTLPTRLHCIPLAQHLVGTTWCFSLHQRTHPCHSGILCKFLAYRRNVSLPTCGGSGMGGWTIRLRWGYKEGSNLRGGSDRMKKSKENVTMGIIGGNAWKGIYMP